MSSDTSNSMPVCVVNEELARKYLEGGDPVGALISAAVRSSGQVVGVIRQVKVEGPADQVPEIYVPYTQTEPKSMALAVRTTGDPLSMVKAVQRAIGRVDKDLALTRIQTLDEIAGQSVARPRFRAILAASFALSALALAGLGVYGVIAFGVSQRVKEFGIRLVLGATDKALLRRVLNDGLRIAATGIAIGLALAATLTRYLSGFLLREWSRSTR